MQGMVPRQDYMEIYSITGQLINTIMVQENVAVNVEDLPPGMYQIKIFRNEALLSVNTLIKTD